MCFCHTSSVTLPLDANEYPQLHRCRPNTATSALQIHAPTSANSYASNAVLLATLKCRRYPNQQMRVIPIDRTCICRHLQTTGNFPKKLPRPHPYVSHQHRVPIIYNPYHWYLRSHTTWLLLLQAFMPPTKYQPTFPSPAGEGFTHPQRGTLKPLAGGT